MTMDPEACFACLDSETMSVGIKRDMCAECANTTEPYTCNFCLASAITDWVKKTTCTTCSDSKAPYACV